MGLTLLIEFRLRPSAMNLSEDVLTNKARNRYYFLPLILGIIGLFLVYHGKDKNLVLGTVTVVIPFYWASLESIPQRKTF